MPAPLELITGHNLLGQATQFIDGVYRVRSFTPAPWLFGLFVSLLLPFAFLAIIHKDYSKPIKVLGRVALIFGMVGVFLSFIRAAWISGVIVFALLGLYYPRTRKGSIIIMIIAILGLVVTFPLYSQTTAWHERVINLQTWIARSNVLRQQFQVLMDNLWFGTGIMVEPVKYYIRTVITPNVIYHTSIVSHNMYMTMLTEYGLTAFFYFFAIVVIFLRGIRALSRASYGLFWGKKNMMTLLAAGSLFLLQAATFDTRYFPSVLIFFWVILGLIRISTNKIHSLQNHYHENKHWNQSIADPFSGR